MDLDELALSGALFATSRSSSPARSPSRSRSPSPDPLWPSNGGNSTDSDLSISPSGSTSNLENVSAETRMGPGRTGVKGVIRDHSEAISLERAKRTQDIKDANRRMEKMALTARTYAEEEEDRLREKARGEGASGSGRRVFQRTGQFGHLREVGEAGFLDAIEGEMSETWVVLHIYDPSLARCHDVDAVLARLARQYPQTKFLRARAGAVGFASLPTTRPLNPSSLKSRTGLITISENSLYDDDDDGDDDPYSYNDAEDEEEAQVTTDTDMLPTLLVYRSGQIVHTWIRVDWEAEAWTKTGDKGGTSTGNIEALLRGHNIIQRTSNGNCGFSSDEEELALTFAQDGGGDDDDLFDL